MFLAVSDTGAAHHGFSCFIILFYKRQASEHFQTAKSLNITDWTAVNQAVTVCRDLKSMVFSRGLWCSEQNLIKKTFLYVKKTQAISLKPTRLEAFLLAHSV